MNVGRSQWSRASKGIFRFALIGLIFTLCPSAEAQQPGKILRIGLLASAPASSPSIEAFRQRLQELGYVDGKNVRLEIPNAEGRVDRFADLAADLVRLKVAVIVAGTDPAVRGATSVTKSIPIVMAGVTTDAGDTGLVETMCRPGGELRGL